MRTHTASQRVSRTVATAMALGLFSAACSGGTGGGPVQSPPARSSIVPGSDYHPAIDPANFTTVIDNPYFPLRPGTTYVLDGRTRHGPERDEVVVTGDTRSITGVESVVVHDTITVNGEVEEETFDWYAQDLQGNVWYFGEDTKTYKNGRVTSTEGSWEAGVDGAEPGIIMPADPKVNEAFRMEYLAGHAEDMFWVVTANGRANVPLGSYEGVVSSLEWTPLEPNVVTRKLYAPGVGLVQEENLSGGLERFVLAAATARPEG